MDANQFQNEKLSIKNLLFTKAIPTYKLPVNADGHLLYVCTDCGDKFIIKSSYEYHIKRKSLMITYFCRHCNISKVFFNRCDLLSHIRSHVFKTATISISDLKIEPLPLSFYNYQSQTNSVTDASLHMSCSINQDDIEIQSETQTIICYDCKDNIYNSGIIYKDRAKHYTQYRNIVYSCPICLLTLTTKCALEAHLRIHKREPPYYCSDCGMFLSKKAIMYPYTHYCDSFKMMRATAKLKCTVNNCNKIFHPSEGMKHLKADHLKFVYKCPTCSVACYKLDNMEKHLKSFHVGKSKYAELEKLKHIDFLQCEMCPGRLVIPSQIDRHLKSHENIYINSVYPCWTCGTTFKLAKDLLEHQESKHPDIYMEKVHGKVTHEATMVNPPNRAINPLRRTFANCDKCKRNVPHDHTRLPRKMKANSNPKIKCNLCQATVIQDWNTIKKHYAIYHKEHVCLDAKIKLRKMSINRKKRTMNDLEILKNVNDKEKACIIKNRPVDSQTVTISSGAFVCSKCGQDYENKQSLEIHIVEHRDPFMAYQCMECGESFIAKPSFSTHLLVKHGINDVNSYIEQKKCYNVESLNLQKPIINEQTEPVKENQCNICREQFYNSTDFEKHFRVHGMAFLMKNTNKPISPEK